MIEAESQAELSLPAARSDGTSTDAMSVWELFALLFEHRRRILASAAILGALAVIPSLFRAPTYTAQGSFVLSGTDASRSALAGLAGQLGVAVPTSSATTSPQLYADLLTTRAILTPVVADSFRESSAARAVPFTELFDVAGSNPAERRDNAIRLLGKERMQVLVDKNTGMMTVLVTTNWPLVSYELASAVLASLDRFTIDLRRRQALAERQFSDERLGIARDSLRSAEDRLQAFLRVNRQWQNSPDLSFTYDRLQRAVLMQQQQYTSSVEANEDARAREARDTPTLTILDAPAVPSSRDPRGRLRTLVVGGFVGALVAVLWTLIAWEYRRRQPLAEIGPLASVLGSGNAPGAAMEPPGAGAHVARR